MRRAVCRATLTRAVEVRKRWQTPGGQRRLVQLLTALRNGRGLIHVGLNDFLEDPVKGWVPSDLDGIDLPDEDLSNAKAREWRFDHANFTGSRWCRADLTDALAGYSHFAGSDFT